MIQLDVKVNDLNVNEVSKMLKRLNALREAGGVTRCHTVTTIRQHTIAEHVYGAMVLARELCALNDRPPAPILCALLEHDAAELETGDIPAPVKRANPQVREAIEQLERIFNEDHGCLAQYPLPKQDHEIVKAADWLDLGFTALEERQLGNRHHRVSRMMQNILTYTKELLHVRGVFELRGYLEHEWKVLG